MNDLLKPEPTAAETEADVASVFGFEAASPPEAAPPAQSPPATPEATPGGDVGLAPASPPVTSAPAPSAPGTPALPSLETPTPPQATPTPPPAEEVPSEEKLRLNSLEAQVQALMAENQSLKAQPPADQTAPVGDAGTAEKPLYQLSVPDQVKAMLFGEDANAAGVAIDHIINGVALNVHKTVVQAITNELKTALEAQGQNAEQTARSNEAAEVRTKYFQKFEAHNKPAITPIVQAEAARLQTEFPGLKWDDVYINALGARVNAALASLAAPAADPEPAPFAPPPAVPARPAAMMPTSTRENMIPVDNQEDLVADTFSPW